MNASAANVLTCPHGRCCQPATIPVPVGLDSEGGLVELEFCEVHALERTFALPAPPPAAAAGGRS